MSYSKNSLKISRHNLKWLPLISKENWENIWHSTKPSRSYGCHKLCKGRSTFVCTFKICSHLLKSQEIHKIVTKWVSLSSALKNDSFPSFEHTCLSFISYDHSFIIQEQPYGWLYKQIPAARLDQDQDIWIWRAGKKPANSALFHKKKSQVNRKSKQLALQINLPCPSIQMKQRDILEIHFVRPAKFSTFFLLLSLPLAAFLRGLREYAYRVSNSALQSFSPLLN